MNSNKVIIAAGLCFLAASILFDRNTRYDDDDSKQESYIEFATILWKAHVYQNEIKFVSNDRVLYTTRFTFGEKHVDSVSYRNLNGYFDPVLVTVWQHAEKYKALIIDPVREEYLLQVDAESEIDVSVSVRNKIILSFAKSLHGDGAEIEDYVVEWPY